MPRKEERKRRQETGDRREEKCENVKVPQARVGKVSLCKISASTLHLFTSSYVLFNSPN